MHAVAQHPQADQEASAPRTGRVPQHNAAAAGGGPTDLPHALREAAGTAGHGGSPGSSGSSRRCSLSMTLSLAQIPAVEAQLFSVQAMTGAALLMIPLGSDLFELAMFGSQQQVLEARSMLQDMVGGRA